MLFVSINFNDGQTKHYRDVLTIKDANAYLVVSLANEATHHITHRRVNHYLTTPMEDRS